MAFLDHIKACNRHDISRYRPFLVERRHVGWVRLDTAGRLAAFPDVFTVSPEAVSLKDHLDTPEARSAAIDEVAERLHKDFGTPRLRGERYLVAPKWGDVPLMTIDRGIVSLFGVRSYGVHVNGYVETDQGLNLWIARRSDDKPVAPGKLDNIVAGGQPYQLSLFENLMKEAAEEADMPHPISATARPAGMVSYTFEDEWGLKPDVMFCYDLEVPAYFTPRNTDGEIADFRLMHVAEVAALVRDTDLFKYNVNLVIIDFMVRHGILTPEDEPDYTDIVKGLRQGW